jgi:hypothetical protein
MVDPEADHLEVLPLASLRIQYTSITILHVEFAQSGELYTSLSAIPHTVELAQQPLLHAKQFISNFRLPTLGEVQKGTPSVRRLLRAGPPATPTLTLSPWILDSKDNLFILELVPQQ